MGSHLPPAKKEAIADIAAIHKYLKLGFVPHGISPKRGECGSVGMAALDRNVPIQTLSNRISKGGTYERHYGLKVDWSLWKPKEPEKLAQDAPKPSLEPILRRQLTDKAISADRRAAEAERRAIAAEGLREAVFKLAAQPIHPPSWFARTAGKEKHAEAIVLFLSDVHMGEVISLEQMGGRNSYDRVIAAKRLERLFQSVVSLGTEHWSGPKPAVIYLVLGGDMVAGEIHEELAKTNDLLAIPAVRDLTAHLVSGLDLLLKNFDCPINVISLPGNHGRTTRKPEAKGFALDSYDTLVSWCIESWFAARGEKRISVSAPASGDALVNILGWNVLLTHGDRIGSRGGAGFVGPAATAARGMQRIVQDYAAEGTVIDFIIIGHFHSPMELEYGFVNGCLSGPSEYSRSGRMRSHPASQWMLSVHPNHGIARRWKIQVGDPSEGSIYKGRAA